MLGGDFDPAALREELEAGRIEDALERLSRTPRETLPVDIAAVRWWPAGARALRLRTLREEAARDALESADQPTIVSPLDARRAPPEVFRLREPAPRPLVVDVQNLDLGLPVTKLEVPRGATEVRPDVSWIPGTAFVITVHEAASGAAVALARFDLLSGPRGEALARAMRTAWDLAPEGPAAGLLAALVALHHGLHEEALERLEPALDADGELRSVARELRAIALAEMGLDLTAVASLDEPREDDG